MIAGVAEHSAPTPPINRRRVVRALDALSTLAAGGITAVLLIWPVPTEFSTRIAGAGDGQFYLWEGWRVADLIRHGTLFPLHIPDVIWPYGSNLAVTDGTLPLGILSLWNLVASPMAAYNLALITAIVLNVWAGRRLAAMLTPSRTIALLCGIAFATAPALTLRLQGQYNLCFAFTAPLIIAQAIRTVRDRTTVRWIRLGALLFVAYLCSAYYLVFGALAAGVIIAAGAQSRRAAARQVGRIVLAGMVTTALMLPFIVPRLSLEHNESAHNAPVIGVEEANLYSADAASIISQPPGAAVPIPNVAAVRNQPNGVEATIFPGLLLLAGAGTVLLLRSRVRWPLLGAAGALWVLSLGPTLRIAGHFPFAADFLPYRILLAIPGLGELRAPNRAGFVLVAVLTAGAALALGWLWQSRSGRLDRLAIAAGAVALMIPNWVTPMVTSDFNAPATIQPALATIAADSVSTDTVLPVPADCTAEITTIVGMQYYHHHPMVGCQAQTSAIPWYSGIPLYRNSAGLAALRCDPRDIGPLVTAFSTSPDLVPAGVAELHRDFGVRFVIVDKAALASPSCAEVATHLRQLSGAKVLADDPAFTIIDLQSLERAP